MQTTKNSIKMAERKVKAKEPVTVYATGSTSHYTAGAEMKVHAALADKLIAAGKATKEAPKTKKNAE